MAEGWARYLGGDQIEALSAGIEAHGKNSLAISVMREAGVDISGQESTKLTDELLASTDYLVTVCGHADVPGSARRNTQGALAAQRSCQRNRLRGGRCDASPRRPRRHSTEGGRFN